MTVTDDAKATEPSPDAMVAAIPGLAGVAWTTFRGEEILFPTRERYLEVVTALRQDGFVTCSDLCGVDYLLYQTRSVPADVAPERFEVVVNLLSHARAKRMRLRVQIPEGDATCPTLFYLYPGTEAMEREVFDMFGIVFANHPDMTRILMPADWEGHPLRKDYSVGRVPVQFKEAPGPR